MTKLTKQQLYNLRETNIYPNLNKEIDAAKLAEFQDNFINSIYAYADGISLMWDGSNASLDASLGRSSLELGELATMDVSDLVTEYDDRYFQGNLTEDYIPKSDGNKAFNNSLIKEVAGGIEIEGNIYAQGDVVAFGTAESPPNWWDNLASHVDGSTIVYSNNTLTCLVEGGAGESNWTKTGDDIYYTDGNVGIGTTNPGAKLHIRDGTDINLRIGEDITFGGITISGLNDAATTGVPIRFQYGEVRFRRGSIVNLMLSSDNRVGIGTTTPSAKLEIESDTSIFNLETSGSPYLRFDTDGATTEGTYRMYTWGSSRTLAMESMGDVAIVIDYNNNQTDKAFRVLHDGEGTAGTELFRVQEDGHVGIGTDSPDYGLDVKIASSIVANFQRTNGTVAAIRVANTLSSGALYFRSTWQTNHGLKLGALSNADTKLHVESADYNDHITISRGGFNFNITPTTSSGGQLRFLSNGTGYHFYQKIICNEQFETSAELGYQIGNNDYGDFANVIRSSAVDSIFYLDSNKVSNGWGFRTHNNNSGFAWAARISHSGNIEADGEVTAFSSSDRRLKTITGKVENASDIINKLNPVTFLWNEEAIKLNNRKDATTKQYGLIAQELEEVLPEMVHSIYNKKYKGIDYEKLIPLLIANNKEQNDKIKKLEDKINRLEKIIDKII